jgi:hypothetical protein
MIVNLNFNIEAWVKQLAIEAVSEEEAVNKLMHMSLAEMIEAGAIVDSAMKYDDVETTISEYSLVVQVSNIKWSLDPETMDASVIEYLKNFLPKETKVTLEDVTDSDDVEELIKDALFYESDYDVESFDFQVLEKK